MENKRLGRNPQETSTVPSTEVKTEVKHELIPDPTAQLVEKPFAKNILRNSRQALQKFDEWLAVA